jgi:phosphoribosylformylglycinamidine cyclo-ligase
VPRARVIDGRGIVAGDVLIALPSSGLHTNGYSLARRIVFDVLKLDVEAHVAELGETVAEALMRPHRSYLRPVRPLLDRGLVKGMAHITGGGITENLPRTLPEGRSYSLDRRSWEVPPVFAWLQRAGGIADGEMFRTFNMGVGLILVCAPGVVDDVLGALSSEGAWRLGSVG